jgi:DNA-binding HxlR family transcriptional regulator
MKEGTQREPGQGSVTACLSPNPKNPCPVRSILERVGDKWATQIISRLSEGTTRFNGLKRQVDGISQRMLTETLRKLERDGLLARTVYPTNPPSVDYTLTPLGETLVPIIRALVGWAKTNNQEIKTSRDNYDVQLVSRKVFSANVK